jgi:chitinase
MKPIIALKNMLTSGSIALGLALMLLTTICHAQPHNVVYWNGDSTNLPTLASSSYDVVIVDFVTPDQNCDLSWGGSTPNGGLPSDIGTSIQTLHNAGKNVLVSLGGSDVQSWQYASCVGNVGNLVSQITNIVVANGFNGADIDFEDTNAFLNSWDPNYSGYDGVQFLVQLTIGLYGQLPQGQNIITHAPQSPYWYPVGDPKEPLNNHSQ